MVEQRRTQTRYTVSLPVKLTVEGAARDCTMVNISLGGALVAGAKHPMGQRVQVSFKVPTMPEPIDVGGTVRWADNHGIGVQFDGLRARDVWALNEYFKQLSS